MGAFLSSSAFGNLVQKKIGHTKCIKSNALQFSSLGHTNSPANKNVITIQPVWPGLDKAVGASCGAAGMAESAGGANPRADKPSSTATPMATLERSSRGGALIAASSVCTRQVGGPAVALGASPRTAAVLTGLLESILGGVRPVEMKLEVAEGNSAPVSINSGGLGSGGYMHEGISICQGYVCQKPSSSNGRIRLRFAEVTISLRRLTLENAQKEDGETGKV
ncbi:hypothetical protein Fot_04276 [Forsythia ovata]|uniref:Uncharacterized protein n=1 Tax=Forsythia ovata TaxID=205694 RepID=A0ABD1XC45_9LAMI